MDPRLIQPFNLPTILNYLIPDNYLEELALDPLVHVQSRSFILSTIVFGA